MRIFYLAFFLLLSFYSNSQSPEISISAGYPVGTPCKSLVYGNGIYLALAQTGFYTSADGEAWERQDYPGFTGNNYNRIAFGAGNFVLVGKSGLIMLSTDGLNWSTVTSGTTNQLYDVAFLQGAFYAVGQNRTLLTSADGNTWSPVTINAGTATDYFVNITSGGGAFVISARRSNSTGMFAYSSYTATSNTWTFKDIAFATSNKVQFLRDRYYYFGTAGVYTSLDGFTWTNSTSDLTLALPDGNTQDLGSPNQAFQGIYDGTKVILFGSTQYYGTHGCVFTSSNGTNFTLEIKTAQIVAQGSTFANGKYFQFGNEGIVSSNDGVSYHYSSANYYGAATNGSNFVGVGGTGNGMIFSSPDFNTWTESPIAGLKDLYAVTYTGTNYAAAGIETFIVSADGSTWTSPASMPDDIYCLTYGEGKYVATGFDGNTSAFKIIYSSDGITWNTAFSDPYYIFRIKYVNGQFFALGYDENTYFGAILHSDDGITWTAIDISATVSSAYINDVVFDGSKYHFMGLEYTDPIFMSYGEFFSISTSTVLDVNSYANKGTITTPHPGVTLGGTFGEGAFEFSNGKFLGSVIDANTNETYIVYSENGTDWNALATGETSTIYSVMADGNTFRLVGTGDMKITASFDNVSLPIRLFSFQAHGEDGRSVLEWQTSFESNSRAFLVQHSIDGLTWSTIGTVAAAGNSNQVIDYRFVHEQPAKGLNYYRLVQEDLDGSQELSQVKLVRMEDSPLVRVYPNPTDGECFIELSQPARIHLLNAAGQEVFSSFRAAGRQSISLKNHPAGIYHLVVDSNGRRSNVKIIRN